MKNLDKSENQEKVDIKMPIQLQLKELLPSRKEEMKTKTKSKWTKLLQVKSTFSASVGKCASKQPPAKRLNKECAESFRKRKKRPKNRKPRWRELAEKSRRLRISKKRKKEKGSTKRRNKKDSGSKRRRLRRRRLSRRRRTISLLQRQRSRQQLRLSYRMRRKRILKQRSRRTRERMQRKMPS